MAEKYLKERIHPYDPEKIHSVEEALIELQGCSFQGRNLGRALEVLTNMVQKPKCFKVLTLSGALVPAGMEKVINAAIKHGIVDAIVTTGANLIHSIVNCFSSDPTHQWHFMGHPEVDDEELFEYRINRIYDTFLPEDGYHDAEEGLLALLLNRFTAEEQHILVPSEFFKILGEILPGESFLTVAAQHNVPIFCGATSDSELGLNLMKYRKRGKLSIILDEIKDVDNFAQYITSHDTYGTIILGGGVPRNWAQQVFPYLDQIYGESSSKKFDGYHYSVRFHTAVAYDGGLSGCTISESISWGKYASNSKHQSVWVDSTIGFPLVITALIQRLQKHP